MEIQSDGLKNITTALNKAQGIMQPAKKTQINPFFKSRYAGLEDVIKAVNEAFTPCGLSFTQSTLPGENGAILIVTTIFHTSGEWVRGYLPIKPTKQDPQALGSAITYGKRYGLQALSGQPSEDDDGNTASAKDPENPEKKKTDNLRATLIGMMNEKELVDNEKRQLIKFYCVSKKYNFEQLDKMNATILKHFIENFQGILSEFVDSLIA